ncbi:MAG TPA: hypothetical protein VEQ38_25570 [Verrucomicrobiae bacterium]|nr:hypothetical protein [Verrucomicrobiae bacterium]
MANFPDTEEGKITAANLIKTRMASHAWIQGHVGVDFNGHVVVRFQRPMSPTAPSEGGWIESRDDATP